MASPNSLLTRTRFRLAQWLDPFPDKGEAWCIGCELNDGRTLIVPASGHSRHIELHRGRDGYITTRVNWGQIEPHYDEEEDLSCGEPRCGTSARRTAVVAMNSRRRTLASTYEGDMSSADVNPVNPSTAVSGTANIGSEVMTWRRRAGLAA